MLTVVGCLVESHDFRLVALAACICALSSLTTIFLVSRARRALAWAQAGWLAVAAAAGGFGIWATHFIAMLAYAPGVPGGYNVALTALSLVLAILFVGSGLSAAVLVGRTLAAVVGGAILGLGIAAMHYTGMAAYEVAGHKAWDPTMVAASLALGTILGGAALSVRLGGRGGEATTAWRAPAPPGDLRRPLHRHGCGDGNARPNCHGFRGRGPEGLARHRRGTSQPRHPAAGRGSSRPRRSRSPLCQT